MLVNSHLRIPPHSEEAERGVIGSILIESEKCILLCKSRSLPAEAFYIPACAILYRLILLMHSDAYPIDLISVGDKLKKDGDLDKIGGYAFLEGLIDSTPTSAHCEYYVEIVESNADKRNIINLSSDAIDSCYGDETPVGITSKLSTSLLSAVTKEIRDVKADAIESNKELYMKIREGYAQGIPFPFDDITDKINGAPKGAYVPIVGRGGGGKSTFIAFWEGNLISRGFRVLDFPFEDTTKRKQRRIAASMGGYKLSKLENKLFFDVGIKQWRKLTDDEFSFAYKNACKWLDKITELPITFIDERMQVEAICSRARLEYTKNPFDIMFVDGVKDIIPSLSDQNANDDLIARSFAGLSIELDIPIVGVMHMRDIKEDQVITINDIRGNKQIGNHARQVLIWQNGGTQHFTEMARGTGRLVGFEIKSDVILQVAKNNYGPTGFFGLHPDWDTVSFSRVQ